MPLDPQVRALLDEMDVTRYDGMIHGFFGMDRVLAPATQAVGEAAAALREARYRPGP